MPAALQGEELLDKALQVADQKAAFSYQQLVAAAEVQLAAPPFKKPELLNWIGDFQQQLLNNPVVGKSSSLVDALQKASYELQYRADASDEVNQANFSVPNSISDSVLGAKA